MGGFGWNRSKVFAFAAIINISANLICPPTARPDPGEPANNWNFEGERRPDLTELTLAIGKPAPGATCRGKLDELYEVYQVLHPEYRAFADRPGIRKLWRKALLAPTGTWHDTLRGCEFDDLMGRFAENPFSDVRFHLPECPARVARMPPRKREAQELVAELLEYALDGSSYVANTFLGELVGRRIELHPKVRYYLQREFDEDTPETSEWHELMAPYLVPDPGERLTERERRFVDDARAKGDYQAVLGSIDACKRRRGPQHMPPPAPRDI